MRIEAAQAEVSDNVDTSTTFGYLSNPLIEPSATPPVKESSPAVPRFDFYTDPMSAFSGSKRTNNSNQTPQNYISSTPSSGSPMAWRSPSLSGSIFFLTISLLYLWSCLLNYLPMLKLACYAVTLACLFILNSFLSLIFCSGSRLLVCYCHAMS